MGEAFGDDDSEVFVDGDEAAVEGGVEEGAEAEAVGGVGSARGVGAPGEDMAGAKERAELQAGDGASRVVGGEDGSAEERLDAADLGELEGVSWAGWGSARES